MSKINFLKYNLPYKISKELYTNKNILLYNSTIYSSYSNKTNDILKVNKILNINKGSFNIIQGNSRLLFVTKENFKIFPLLLKSNNNKDEIVHTLFNFGTINFGIINNKNIVNNYQVEMDKNKLFTIHKDINNRYFYLKLNEN